MHRDFANTKDAVCTPDRSVCPYDWSYTGISEVEQTKPMTPQPAALEYRVVTLVERHPSGGYDQLVTFANGSVSYLRGGALHREDGPAHVDPSGAQTWLQFDREHRDSGPAVIFSNGAHEYWLDGKRVQKSEWRKLRARLTPLRRIRAMTELSR